MADVHVQYKHVQKCVYICNVYKHSMACNVFAYPGKHAEDGDKVGTDFDLLRKEFLNETLEAPRASEASFEEVESTNQAHYHLDDRVQPLLKELNSATRMQISLWEGFRTGAREMASKLLPRATAVRCSLT